MNLTELLGSNPLLRILSRRASFATFRRVVRLTAVQAMTPPWQRRRLEQAVASCFEHFFPRCSARRYLRHRDDKLAEDLYTLNIAGIEHWLAMVDRYVTVEGAERFVRAFDGGQGVLAVGCHVGSLTLGSGALMSLHRRFPLGERPDTLICMDPEAERYPNLVQTLENALREHQVELRLLLTGGDQEELKARIHDCLGRGGLVTTNIDVMRGGRSKRAFPLFDGRIKIYLPALVGAARAAQQAGATVLPWVCLRTPDGFRLRLEQPFAPGGDLDALCQRLCALLEGWITEAPEQWVYWDRFAHRRARAR